MQSLKSQETWGSTGLEDVEVELLGYDAGGTCRRTEQCPSTAGMRAHGGTQYVRKGYTEGH
jgi:hypothetical protein